MVHTDVVSVVGHRYLRHRLRVRSDSMEIRTVWMARGASRFVERDLLVALFVIYLLKKGLTTTMISKSSFSQGGLL